MSNSDIYVVLFHGLSGAGKTSTARDIATTDGAINIHHLDNEVTLVWDYRAFAEPLASLHNIKLETTGLNATDRQLWTINQSLLELFGPYTVAYDSFVELVYDAVSWELNIITDNDGNVVRDRDFMTGFADKCHALANNPFARYLARQIKINFKRHLNDIPEGNALQYIVLVPDLRYKAELELIKSMFDNVTTIKLDISPEARDQRLLKRDGKKLTPEQLSHATQVSPFNNSDFDVVISTDSMTQEEQVRIIKEYIFNKVVR